MNSNKNPLTSPESQPERERIALPRSVGDIEVADFEAAIDGEVIETGAPRPESANGIPRFERINNTARNIATLIRDSLLQGGAVSWQQTKHPEEKVNPVDRP